MTVKNQATIPLAVRTALCLGPGDTVAFEIEDGVVRLSKASALDLAFADAVAGTLTEWRSAADDEAYRGL
jgi:bifunctional DNA-binding transcriptional regulator/antitoxin component of YhaV-PrlF toxin-antitoxin module